MFNFLTLFAPFWANFGHFVCQNIAKVDYSTYLLDEICSIFPDCCKFVLLFTHCSFSPLDSFVLLFTVLLVVVAVRLLSTSFAGTLVLTGIFSFLLLLFCCKRETDNFYKHTCIVIFYSKQLREMRSCTCTTRS